MRDFLFSLFEVSLTMGAVAALLLALAPVWKRRFRPQWRYWAWLLVALRLAVPLNISLPQAPVTLEAPAPVELSAAWVDEGTEGFQGVEFAARPAEGVSAVDQADTDQAEAPEASAATPGFSLTLAELAFALWLAGAAGVLVVQLARYAAFRRHTRRWSVPAGEYEGIPVETCPLLSAPVLVGLIRPRILLPEGLTGEKRAYALAHEAAHAKRRDLWYKALLLWVCALHWFNPLVWALRRAAERDVEICCDAAALAGKDEGWRRGYGAALLSFVSARPAAPLTSQFAGGVRGLKERFRALVSAAPARRGRLALALVLCAALLGGSLVACRTQEAPEEPTPPTGTPMGEVTEPEQLPEGTPPVTAVEVAAVVHEVDPEEGTLTYAEDDGNVGADSQWITASVPRSSAVDLELLQARVAPLSSWGFSCTLLVQSDGQVVGLKAGPLYDGAYYIGRVNNYTATLAEDGSVLAFDAWLYEVDPETYQVTQTMRESEFWLGWIEESGPESRYVPYEGVALYKEDGTPYEGSVTQFLEEFTADSDALEQARRRYNTVPAVNRLTLRVTVGGGVITSMQRLPAPERNG